MAAGSSPGSAFGLTAKLDGIDQWQSLLDPNSVSPRKEMLYNIDVDPENDYKIVNAGFKYKEMKLLLGNPGKPGGWIPPPKVLDILHHDTDLKAMNELFLSADDDDSCSKQAVRLFNLTQDPFEKVNLASVYPDLVLELKNKLEKYVSSMISPNVEAEILAGNPNNFGGFWGPSWCLAKP